jgi:hypothetical protein
VASVDTDRKNGKTDQDNRGSQPSHSLFDTSRSSIFRNVIKRFSKRLQSGQNGLDILHKKGLYIQIESVYKLILSKKVVIPAKAGIQSIHRFLDAGSGPA